jgi:hypothetical protein
MMAEAASISKTSVNFYQTTRRNISGDGRLYGFLYFLLSSSKFQDDSMFQIAIAPQPCRPPDLYYGCHQIACLSKSSILQ